ncbi:NYN domain-containing protein [Candidatus Parcubacteria bacterium]|nr:NYN domain-containing protein [Candidatus Parcubacteria bacterium]MBI4385560.1 NYN domain-containing protein [Candidatus Parcubacteria bacterium]
MPIVRHKEQRVGVLIDVQNMYHSAKNLFKARVNFDEVVKAGVADRKLIRAIAYVVKSDVEEEKTFFDALTRLGIETKIKDLQVFYGGAKKADWDVGITVDAVRLAPTLDVVVLVSGDGDFVPVVEYLKNQGKQVEVLAFGESSSSRLKETADDFIDLSQDPSRFLIRSKRLEMQVRRQRLPRPTRGSSADEKQIRFHH